MLLSPHPRQMVWRVCVSVPQLQQQLLLPAVVQTAAVVLLDLLQQLLTMVWLAAVKVAAAQLQQQ